MTPNNLHAIGLALQRALTIKANLVKRQDYLRRLELENLPPAPTTPSKSTAKQGGKAYRSHVSAAFWHTGVASRTDSPYGVDRGLRRKASSR